MELKVFVLFYLAVILSGITLVEVKITNWNSFQFQDGKAEFERMQSISELPNYGHCWTQTLIKFSKGCKYLSADVQGKLALAYLNCFLSMQELPIYRCNVKKKFSECTKNMKDIDRISMATFFTHAQNICYFLEAQNWHNKTVETIIILQTTIKDLVVNLEKTKKRHNEILQQQERSFNYHRDNFSNLSKIISTYSNNIHKSINESRTIMDEQHHLLSRIDSNMSAELTVYSIRFYVCMLVLAFFITSTKHTAAAWSWIVLILTFNLWIESAIKFFPLSLTGDVFLMTCRGFSVGLSFFALKASAYLYQSDRDCLSVFLEKADKLITKTYELGKAENKMASDTHIASVDRPNTVPDAPGKELYGIFEKAHKETGHDVPIPMFDRGKGDSRNLLGRVIEVNEMEEEINCETTLSVREAATHQSLSGGQGFFKCFCKTICLSNRCKCKKNGRKCNSRCHSSTTCDNK